EEAFVVRMAPKVSANEGSIEDELTATPIEPTSPVPPSASRRPRGRPRKAKASIEKASSVAQMPMVDDSIPSDMSTAGKAETRDLNATTVIKIDKSFLRFGEVRRYRDKVHLRFVALQPCLLCGRTPSDPHHLRFAQPRAMGRKTSDE